MKLISLYIENFGGLSRYELHFDKGLTTVNEPNGFGKSTLAEFIRAMLYGFPRKVKTLEKSRRQKYAPWNGGLYGGNLVFEQEGRKYRIERTFGATPKGDTFTLIDLETNRESSRFSEDIGIELFGLDSDSFERSAYLPQLQEDGPLATAAIQAKLSNLVEGSSDVANFDAAIAVLRSKRSALIPYRGNGGSVAEAAGRIAQLQLKLDHALRQRECLADTHDSVARLEKTIETTQAELARTREELAAASQIVAAEVQQRQYAELQQRCMQVSAQVKRLSGKFPKGLPDDRALAAAEAAADRLALLTAQSTAVQAEEQMKLHLQREVKQLSPVSNGQFMGSLIGGILAITAGAAGIAIGAFLLFMQQTTYGSIGLTIGITLLTAGLVWLLVHRKKHRAAVQERCLRQKILDEQISAARQQLHALQNDTERVSAEIRTFFAAWGQEMERDVRAQLRQLREDIRDARAAEGLKLQLEAQLAAMEKTYGDILFAELSPAADPKWLKTEEQRLRQELTELTETMLCRKQKVQELRAEASEIPQLQAQIARWQQKKEEGRENARILDDTMAFLQQARENLSTGYLGTIQSRFGCYLSQLEGIAGERYLIDADFRIRLERMGRARELAYFSAGQTDLVMLCMRLALTDAMFKNQEMFVILDDPFVNLDDAHTAQALQLMRKLSSERQILYLTCHSSRIL